jgi:site-specific DNA-cytosine methylase
MRSLDLFSCIGCHAVGFRRAGIQTVAFCEIQPYRRAVLAQHFPGVGIYEDVLSIPPVTADIVIGGPPCKATSVAAAIQGRRTGSSLWPAMFRAGINADAGWFVVEQPPGHAAWEAGVFNDLRGAGFHCARIEFAACDCGAPYIRRRVFILACTDEPRLALAWAAVPRAIECVARAARARGDWDPDKLAALRVDARSAGEMERPGSAVRKQRIEALGDSNPPHMAEVIGRSIMAAKGANTC